MSLICIDCRYINGRPSGIAEMVSSLVQHLPLLAPDLRFRLIVSSDGPALLSGAPNVEQINVMASANGPGTMWWLPRIVDLRGVDLFHATFNILPAGLTMPSITTVHDLMWIESPEWCETGWRQSVRRPFFAHGINRALKQSAAIATVSQATRDALVRMRPDVRERTFVTRSGVSGRFRRAPTDPSALSALGLNPRRRFILTVGQFAPYKNHAGAVRAFALACATRKEFDLVLVQRRGRKSQDLLQLAASLGLNGRVHILSSLSLESLITLYSSAALLLHPSLAEGFGNPLAEAMACGCPVVASNRSAIPEVTADAALLANPEDNCAMAAMVSRVLNFPKIAESMSRRGIKRAAELSWEDFARENLALYRQALSTRSR